MNDFDLLVIGSGPAGEKGAAQAAYFGKRVAVIEREAAPGGAAVHTGTLPSKTLRETALFLAGHRQRELYGVAVNVQPEIAVQSMLARKDAVRGREVERIHWNLARHGIELVSGAARLVDGHTVEVTGAGGQPRTLTATFILVATGSSPRRAENIDFGDRAIDDSDSILGIEQLPRTMAILGGGVIGCEYASIFAELGVQVTLLDSRPALLPFLDSDIAAELRRAMEASGVTLLFGATPERISRGAEGDVLLAMPGGGEIRADHLLVANGRIGATAGLGLESVGVQMTDRGHVRVDHEFRTTVPSVFAAGDVIGNPALASTSMEQGRVAVCHAFGFEYKRDVSSLLPYGIYTVPEVGTVGLSEEAARAAGYEVVVGRANYGQNARGQIMGASGEVKLVFDRRQDRLLGTHVIGDLATELVHLGQVVMALNGSSQTLIDMVFNYPTLSECYKYAAYDALGKCGDSPMHSAAGELPGSVSA